MEKIKEIIKKLAGDSALKFIAVEVNGKRVDLDTLVSKNDKIKVIPLIGE